MRLIQLTDRHLPDDPATRLGAMQGRYIFNFIFKKSRIGVIQPNSPV